MTWCFGYKKEPHRNCCCGSIHVKYAAIAIGIIEICGVIVQGITLANGGLAGAASKTELVYNLGAMIIAIMTIALMFWGIVREKPLLIVPHLSFQLLCVIVFILSATLLLITSLTISNDNETKSTPVFSFVVSVVFYALSILEIWFFFVILMCYRFIQAKTESAVIRSVELDNGYGSTVDEKVADNKK